MVIQVGKRRKRSGYRGSPAARGMRHGRGMTGRLSDAHWMTWSGVGSLSGRKTPPAWTAGG